MTPGSIVLLLFGVLAVCAAGAFWAWHEIGQADISMHGWIAIGLGAGLTILVGVGLMTLLFFSRRHGYDDRAYHTDDMHGGKTDGSPKS